MSTPEHHRGIKNLISREMVGKQGETLWRNIYGWVSSLSISVAKWKKNK